MGLKLQGGTIPLALNTTNGVICITVADDGAGVSQEKYRELNAKTHCMDSADDHVHLRHGLGLPLVRKMVHAHNGTMKIKSSLLKGFKVFISLR